MKMKKITGILAIAMLCISCSKDKDGTSHPDFPDLGGNIIFEYTSDVQIVNMRSWQQSLYFSYNAYSTEGWDLSKDGKLRLISERVTGTGDVTRIKLINVESGEVMKDFNYVPAEGSSIKKGTLSFDNSLIMLEPDFDEGIVILDQDGNVKHRLASINDTSLDINNHVLWLPGNSILITFDDKFLLRADPPYTNLTLVKELNYEQWGNVRTSMDGKRLSLYIGNHIHMMNADGSDLTQVTESDSEENMAEFSPDGKYLLVGTEYLHAPVSGKSNWRLKIIPADGKRYNLDTSPEVIPLIPDGSSGIVQAGGNTFWRP